MTAVAWSARRDRARREADPDAPRPTGLAWLLASEVLASVTARLICDTPASVPRPVEPKSICPVPSLAIV